MNGINWGSLAVTFRYAGPGAALEELRDAGYAVVPVAPTMEMVAEGLKVGSVVEIYRAMVNKAPGVVA